MFSWFRLQKCCQKHTEAMCFEVITYCNCFNEIDFLPIFHTVQWFMRVNTSKFLSRSFPEARKGKLFEVTKRFYKKTKIKCRKTFKAPLQIVQKMELKHGNEMEQ